MLYLAGKEGNKFAVYDSDDETIEYVDMSTLLNAYKSGIKIHKFTNSVYELACKGAEFSYNWKLNGIIKTWDRAQFGALAEFRSDRIRTCKSRDYLSRFKLEDGLVHLDIYNRGILYRLYVQDDNWQLMSINVSNETGSYGDGGRVHYFGYSIEDDMPVVGTSNGILKLCYENIPSIRHEVLLAVAKETYAGIYRKMLFDNMKG